MAIPPSIVRGRAHGLAIGAGAVVIVVLLAAAWPTRTAAHPLGNFTVNHYDRIEVSDAGIEVYSVLDMAEIPAFTERQKIDVNDDGDVDDGESAEYADAKAGSLRSNLDLRVNGRTGDLVETSRELSFPPGQGGLSLLRLVATYRAELPDGWRDTPPRVEFQDRNDPGKIGWREIIVRAAAGVDIDASDVPPQDTSQELTSYPQDSLSSPLDVRSATFGFRPTVLHGPPAPASAADRAHRHAVAVRGNPDSSVARFTTLISKDRLSFGVVAIALLAAVAFGAIHALSPGHGKTIVAAYLVGSHGKARHALLLGLTVTAAHTSSVYALGFVTLYLSQYVVPERLYPWLGIASGGLILAMGLALLAGRLRSSGLLGDAFQRLRSLRSSAHGSAMAVASGEAGAFVMDARDANGRVGGERNAGDAHAHDRAHEHADAKAHGHGFGPAHSHAIPGDGGEPVTWRRLIGLGIFGGLLPCPSAIVVMLSAVALHRVAFGLVLIVAFSFGLAGVLTGIGFAFVYASKISERLPILRRLGDRVQSGGSLAAVAVRVFPSASAMAVIVAGMVITLRALGQQGVL